MLPYGYGNNSFNTTQTWDPKNIVLVSRLYSIAVFHISVPNFNGLQITDGLCSSACAMFVEFMTRMGTRTVVMGGRPDVGPSKQHKL